MGNRPYFITDIPGDELIPDEYEIPRKSDLVELARLRRIMVSLRGKTISIEDFEQFGESPWEWTLLLGRLWRAGIIKKYAKYKEHWRSGRPAGVRYWIWGVARHTR